jgi:signal transduction histidine kinase
MLTVRDNGRGLTEEQVANRSSLGLLGMKERAWFVGGEVLFKAGVEVGTTVIARVPLAHHPQVRTEQIA